ncbi:acyl-CoA dehydrogenase family protein [Chelatococcus reniformis]|uniref:Acyl-CoA dehydrogenase n=1 Tax=Chelatococcus reniformis TaxID=1494448 RepID=A0A916U3G0_9HYPH|nr:acyl-CoA dehydrogenase family protein [Chelatococcus reniformis]GGC58856.1 acyl-CoA dehydrogenase [Chelatococcus reniformis]
MNFTLSDDHLELRDAAQTFLDKEVDLRPLLVPGATATDAGYDTLWRKIAELGWPSLIVPETYGGLGMSYIDLAMVVGEMGRTLAPCPFFGTLAGTWAILRAGSEDQRARLLGRVAGGEAKLALALTSMDGAIGESVAATADGSNHRLTGTAWYVVDAAAADQIVVAARLDGRLKFFVVEAKAAGVAIALLDWRDITRQVGTVTLTGALGELLTGSDDQTWPWVRDRLYLTLAAESAAGTRVVLDDAVTYAKERMAFGRPLGAFQAIKHQLAELAGQAECATAAVHYAAWALTEDDARAPLAAAMAQSYASDAYRDATYRNVQVFGAIGFTWEMKNHLYYKRARCNAELLGPPAQQREEVIQLLERQAA